MKGLRELDYLGNISADLKLFQSKEVFKKEISGNNEAEIQNRGLQVTARVL